MAGKDDKIAVENINVPGLVTRVDAAKYADMKAALARTLPRAAPGATQAEMKAAALPHLSADLFPGGATAGWWAKAIQLDLEAKGQLAREATKPLRWHVAPGAAI